MPKFRVNLFIVGRSFWSGHFQSSSQAEKKTLALHAIHPTVQHTWHIIFF